MLKGTCEFGQTCRFNHPEQAAPGKGIAMVPGTQKGKGKGKGKGKEGGKAAREEVPKIGENSLGYPMRPGAQPCAFYMKQGVCSYGQTCKWDHPEPQATV